MKFEPGKVYANRDGEYEVLSVDSKSGRMEVRYLATGVTRSLDMTIQARITGNLQLEGRIAERAEQEKAASPRPRGAKKPSARDFTGMRPEDFGTVAGTTWRASLGARLPSLLKGHPRAPFKSKVPPRWPRVFLSHQADELMNKDETPRIAKYIVWADEDGFHYGLYLERRDEQYRDWERFATKLAQDGDLRALVDDLEKQGLRVHGTKEGVPFLPADASWEERLDAMSNRHDGEYRDLYLSFSLPVDQAVARGRGLVDEVAEALVKLAPLYIAATS